MRDCSLEEEAGCEESVDGVSGKVSQTNARLMMKTTFVRHTFANREV